MIPLGAKPIGAFCLALSVILAAGTATAFPKPRAALIQAVHPYLPYGEVMRRYAPSVRYPSDRLGRTVQARVGHSYEEHTEGARILGAIKIGLTGPVKVKGADYDGFREVPQDRDADSH